MSTQTEHAPTASTPLKAPKRSWGNLATLIGVTVVDNTEAGLINILFPAISKAFGLDTGHLGTIAAASKIVLVPFSPIWVWAATKIGRKQVLAINAALAGVFGILGGFSNGFLGIVLWNTLLAIALAGSGPLVNAIISDSFPDKQRAKAVSSFYGAITLIGAFLAPVVGSLSKIEDGWRIGYWSVGALCFVGAIIVMVAFKDPGVGASDAAAAGGRAVRTSKPSLREVLGLFRIPSFSIMLGSRLLSGHLLIAIFSVQFIVMSRGFDNAVASVVMLAFGVGYFAGSLLSGVIMGILDRTMPHRGRVFFLQFAQVFFAIAAFISTQFDFGNKNILIYAVLWAIMGSAQGLNPGINRPIIMSVIAPHLRGQAFAIYINIFETIGWALFALGAGFLIRKNGFESVFLIVLVGLMLCNALFLSLLHLTYKKDVQRAETIALLNETSAA